MGKKLTQQLIVSLFTFLFVLLVGQLSAADKPYPKASPPFTVAPSGGNAKVDYKQWNFTALATSDTWLSQNPPTHLSTGTVYGDFPTRSGAATFNSEITYGGYITIAPGTTGATGAQFLTMEGYLIMPCYASSVQLRVKDSLTEQYSSLHLALNGGNFTTNSADLIKVSEEKINNSNVILTNTEYTVSSGNYGKWVRFGVAISNGRLAYSSRLEWNLNGNGWATIPADAFSSITGGTGLLVTTSPLCAAAPASCECSDALSCNGLNIYANQAAADAAIVGATYSLYNTKPFEDYTLPINNVHTYCVTYTTGATETRIGIRNFVSQISTCSFTRTYSVTQMNCSTPATFVSSGNGSYNYYYYNVLPNTQYRICASITNFTGTGCANAAIGNALPTTVASGTLVFNVSPAAAAFTYNCGSATTTGTFTSNGTGGQTGTLTVPLTATTTAGSAIFNVAGTGFTGTLATILTAGQTSVVIPITYDGTGAAGSRTLTVTASVGTATGSCSKAVTVVTPPTAYSFPFNCSGSTVNGAFFANGVSQTGTLTVPINVTSGGSTTVTVTGTNFSGSLTTTVTTAQASLTIPITYTGAGSEGSRLLSITSADATGTCSVSVPIQASCKANGGRIGQ